METDRDTKVQSRFKFKRDTEREQSERERGIERETDMTANGDKDRLRGTKSYPDLNYYRERQRKSDRETERGREIQRETDREKAKKEGRERAGEVRRVRDRRTDRPAEG